MMSSFSFDAAWCLETDSSGKWGCGGMLGQEYFAIKWPESVARADVSRLELYPVVAGIHMWAEKLANNHVLILTDNKATETFLNSFGRIRPISDREKK